MSFSALRPWLRVSLRAWFVLFALIGALLALRQRSAAQHRIADRLERDGAKLHWNCTDTPQSRISWLLCGDNYYDDLFGVFFEGRGISAAEIDQLRCYPHLIRIRFTNCVLTDDAFPRLAALPELRELTIDQSTVSSSGIEACARAPALARLELHGLDVANVDFSRFGSLQRLEVHSPSLDDQHLAQIATISTLTSLWIEEAAITDAGLANLGKLPSLDSLTLRKTKVSGTGLRPLADRGELLFLNLTECPINPAGAAALGKIHQLRVLQLNSLCLMFGDILELQDRLPKCEIRPD